MNNINNIARRTWNKFICPLIEVIVKLIAVLSPLLICGWLEANL